MHNPHCIRSDGDWICVAGCTHDRDEAVANDRAELMRLREQNDRLRDALHAARMWIMGCVRPGAGYHDVLSKTARALEK